MTHTLLLIYLGGVIAELLQEAGHWRAFRSTPLLFGSILGENHPLPQYPRLMTMGLVIGLGGACVMNALKWPYRLTRKLINSSKQHVCKPDEILELVMEMWRLQMIADYRLDAPMSIHEARSRLADVYAALMENMEEVSRALPEGTLRAPQSKRAPPRDLEIKAVQMPIDASEIAAAVAAMVPPPEPEEEKLRAALKALQQEFPGTLHEVRVERALGERSPSAPEVAYGSEQFWDKLTWTVQVGNERAYNESLEAAIVELRKELAVEALRPERARRIAEVLREIPDKRFERIHALGDAQKLLEDEQRAARMKGAS